MLRLRYRLPPRGPARPAPLLLSAIALAAVASSAMAQTAPPQTLVITGNPLGREPGATPASVLSGSALLQRRAGTLGETLDGLPGVASTGFGPNAGRPVIRGLDGDRIRVLDNGGASVDASSLSFDHAVASDPLVADRIEVLRGPAALLYGGNATGGVVNSIDNRVPRAPISGLAGRAEVRLGGAAGERSGAAVLDGGSASGLAWHLDAFGRQTEDLRTPRYTPIEDGQALEASRRVRNSAADARGGAIGAGWAGRDGFAGIALDSYRNNYGVTVEPDVTIRMKRERLSAAGEWRGIAGSGSALSLQASRTDYRHQEVEGSGEVGTTFDSTGSELRAELRHAPLGPLQGVVGVQAERLAFSALGEEAFVPSTRTRSAALFVLEELNLGRFTLTGGARFERVRVSSAGDGAGAEEERFGAARTRSFSPLSASLQASTRWAGGWTAHAGIGRTQRAPAYYELYANGEHVATAAYERGDPTLPLERSQHLEAGLAWAAGGHSASVNLFRTRFANYIALDATGERIDELPEYAFRAVRARLTGLEAEWRSRFTRVAAPGSGGPSSLEISAGLDAVRGDNLDRSEPLPRLPPLRLRAGAAARWGELVLSLSALHARAQNRVPQTDIATAGWTRVDLGLSGSLASRAIWTLTLRNVGNTLAYNASAIQTVRGLSPQAGRALAGTLQFRF